MQQSLINLAARSGAEIRRPIEVVRVIPGDPPAVVVSAADGERRLTARLVIGADGRNSRVRAVGQG